MKKDFSKGLHNPQKMYYDKKYPKQLQPSPGLQEKMKPVPDCGEESYIGRGRLERRKALITGGDSGIGRAVAIAYAREGAKVAINYLQPEQKDADDLAAVLSKENIELIQIPGDLRDEKECIRVIKQAEKKLGGLDILVLNASVQFAQEDILKLSTKQIHHTFETNVFAVMYMSREAMKYLPEGSSVIITSSAENFKPSKTLLDYAATKAAQIAFGRAFAKQAIDKGVRVNMVCPGPIWTALEIAGGLPEDKIPAHGQDSLMKRLGQPAELAGAYVYLASNESSYVTGEIITVTGGSIA